MALISGVLEYNRKLVKNFKSGANLLPQNRNYQLTPTSQQKRRAVSMAAIDLSSNGTPEGDSSNQTQKLLKFKRNPIK